MLSLFFAPTSRPAQISGVTPPLPPGVERRFEVFFGNDSVAIGKYPDDYRTQQFAVILNFFERWNAIIDHSILTLDEPAFGDPERIDQLSGSIGYLLSRRERKDYSQELEIGAGFRIYGEHAGARIQNGFHKLIDDPVLTMPYVDDERTDGTAWLRFNRDGILIRDFRLPALGTGWDFGYWGRATTLVTTDGQWDGNIGALAVVSKRWFQLWLGTQGDWRQGYDRDNVTRETAAYEEAVTLVAGMRLGPFRIETERELDGDSIYGHASLVSSGEPLKIFSRGDNRWGVEAGLTMPDVYATLQGRWANCTALGCSGFWQRALVLGFMYGKPQLGSDVTRYVETWQIGAAFEFERAPFERWSWLTGYGSLGAGWRSERIDQEKGPLAGTRSDPVNRFGLTGELGLRYGTSAGGQHWTLAMYTAVGGWLPSSDGETRVGDDVLTLQEPQLVIRAGLLARFY
ncbi:MAG: hypothetical protein ACN4GT_06360 [Gammaproteobacteria bacterium]